MSPTAHEHLGERAKQLGVTKSKFFTTSLDYFIAKYDRDGVDAGLAEIIQEVQGDQYAQDQVVHTSVFVEKHQDARLREIGKELHMMFRSMIRVVIDFGVQYLDEDLFPKAVSQPTLPSVIGIASHKGGVGKTTTAVNLAISLAEMGRRVLVIDTDGQANLSMIMGVYRDTDVLDAEKLSIKDVLITSKGGRRKLSEVMQKSAYEGIWAVPSTIAFIGSDAQLRSEPGAAIDSRLMYAVEDLVTEQPEAWDYIIIDCPPAAELIVTNAVMALKAGAKDSKMIIPVVQDGPSIAGASNVVEMLENVAQDRREPTCTYRLLRTMYNPRQKSFRTAEKLMKTFLADVPQMTTKIRQTAAVMNAAATYEAVCDVNWQSVASQDYRELAKEIDLERTHA